ncbi:diaminopimelate epimerase [Christiangramia salexigens]|uniref:Diaminopimelate epimerase n=1 Tax=Christiangramia salexigens TaxID=1913577 RepID=A0A1L3J1G4_9FLAO|nr:diaminopimelate epimerase [Christiangramia salexigens]APG58963.1 diaminopimelate epimerase [Christiangramia salexigens]
MKLEFYKYQGTGNDFVMLDNRDSILPKNSTKLIRDLCDRKFGIGADGLICLENPENNTDDFKMVYFNADGNESSMCGNGGRCLVAFAKFLGIIENSARFTAIDGPHEAIVKDGIVSLKMQDVEEFKEGDEFIFLNTGSPHHVSFIDGVSHLDVKKEGAAIRYSKLYRDGGTNVNFVQEISKDTFSVRTYERGVEDETLSCGTGVTAVALAASFTSKTDSEKVKLITPGGELSVSFKKQDKKFTDVWLSGPAQQVFKGDILC